MYVEEIQRESLTNYVNREFKNEFVIGRNIYLCLFMLHMKTKLNWFY